MMKTDLSSTPNPTRWLNSPKNISTVISWFQQESLYIWNIIKNLTRLGEYPNVSVKNMGLPDNSDTHNWKYDDYQMDSG